MDKLNSSSHEDRKAAPRSGFSNKLIVSLLFLIVGMLVVNIWYPRLTHNGPNQEIYQISQKINAMSDDLQDVIKMQKKLNTDFATLMNNPSALKASPEDEKDDLNSVLKRYSPGSKFIYESLSLNQGIPVGATTAVLQKTIQ